MLKRKDKLIVFDNYIYLCMYACILGLGLIYGGKETKGGGAGEISPLILFYITCD